MFNLRQILDEGNIDYEYFASTVNLEIEEFNCLLNTGDENCHEELYYKFIKFETDKKLKPKLNVFYNDYMESEATTCEFIDKCLLNDTTRRMVNILKRHVEISEYMIEYKPERGVLVLFNLIVAIESIYKLSGNKIDKKIDRIIDFFSKRISDEHKQLLYDGIMLNRADDLCQPGMSLVLNMEDCARILYELRNMYAHEGDYWSFSFPSIDNDFPVLNELKVIIGGVKKRKRTINVKISIPQLKKIVIEGLISYIDCLASDSN